MQPKELSEPVLGYTEVPNGVPTSHDFDSHIPSEVVPFSLPHVVRHSSLVPVPDAREPLARHLLLKDSKFADHPRQAAAGKTTAREPKKTDFISRGIVVHEKVVPREDVMVDPPADAACVGGYYFTPPTENIHLPRACLAKLVGMFVPKPS